MSNVPSDLKYTKSHEWVRVNEDGTVTVGITDHAQELLGDLVFVETPEAGAVLAGEVVEGNALLDDAPETINNDAYGDGWLFKLRPENAGDLDDLMDADAYNQLLEDEA